MNLGFFGKWAARNTVHSRKESFTGLADIDVLVQKVDLLPPYVSQLELTQEEKRPSKEKTPRIFIFGSEVRKEEHFFSFWLALPLLGYYVYRGALHETKSRMKESLTISLKHTEAGRTSEAQDAHLSFSSWLFDLLEGLFRRCVQRQESLSAENKTGRSSLRRHTTACG